jgi:hypothetical protein
VNAQFVGSLPGTEDARDCGDYWHCTAPFAGQQKTPISAVAPGDQRKNGVLANEWPSVQIRLLPKVYRKSVRNANT